MGFLPKIDTKIEDINKLLAVLVREIAPGDEDLVAYRRPVIFGRRDNAALRSPCRISKVMDLSSFPMLGLVVEGFETPYFETHARLDAMTTGFTIGLEIPRGSSQPFTPSLDNYGKPFRLSTPGKLSLLYNQHDAMQAIVSFSLAVEDVYDVEDNGTTAGRLEKMLRSMKKGSGVYSYEEEDEILKAMNAVMSTIKQVDSYTDPLLTLDIRNAKYLLGVTINKTYFLIDPTDVSSAKDASNPRIKDFTVGGYLVAYNIDRAEGVGDPE